MRSLKSFLLAAVAVLLFSAPAFAQSSATAMWGLDTVTGARCPVGFSATCAAKTQGANDGAGGTGISQPTGGSGILGWLSGIYQALTGGTLASSANQTAANGKLDALHTDLTTGQVHIDQAALLTRLNALPTNVAQETGGNLAALVTNTAQLHADLIAATPPGEFHIGEIGGNATTITSAQTVTASSAYASGNAIGGLITLSTAARVSSGSGLLQSVAEYTKSAQSSQTDVFLFSSNPSSSTCTDKTAFSLATADFDKVIGVAHVSDWTSGGTPSFGQAQNLAMPFALASGTTVYACAVTRGTPTFSSTSDVSFGFRFLRN